MIIDLQKFVVGERPYWSELESVLDRLEDGRAVLLPLDQTRRFHYLYERASAGLGKMATFSSEPETRRYLETLVARAYGEIHETRARANRFSPWTWLIQTWPQTFRRHVRAFWLSSAITLAGAVFGALAVAFDPEAKEAVLPEQFANHLGDPSERVAREERGGARPGAGGMTSFSAQLMVNNIGVSIKALALGLTYGVGTMVILFYNGVILGVVGHDYVLAGQTKFLLAWILPHGVIEIPAVLMGGQGGLLLAGALIGRGDRRTMRQRLRALAPEVITLICGVAILLVWAGVVEAFISQFHEPALPYVVKIAFGVAELALLVWFLSRCGRSPTKGSTV